MARLTGFSPAVRRVIKERAGIDGEFVVCERCGIWTKEPQLHHRRPRGSGGTRRPSTNLAANGLVLCRLCHMWVERNRAESEDLGLLISQHTTEEPCEIPAVLRYGTVLMDNDGGWTPTEAAA